MLRLNVAIPPASKPNPLGVLGGDLAGTPTEGASAMTSSTIALRAVAGVTYPLVEKGYEPDGAAEVLTQGLTPLPFRSQPMFPYVATPHGGYDFPSTTS